VYGVEKMFVIVGLSEKTIGKAGEEKRIIVREQ
jgi:hypothetical protein